LVLKIVFKAGEVPVLKAEQMADVMNKPCTFLWHPGVAFVRIAETIFEATISVKQHNGV